MLLLLGLLVIPYFTAFALIDRTQVERAAGSDVVETVVDLIRDSCIFPNDNLFLRRLAFVETRDGTDPKTFRAGYYGGIWQVDKSKFLYTQSNCGSLHDKFKLIQSVFSINWMQVQWHDLLKPLHSVLGASLLVMCSAGVQSIPLKLDDQATFWENEYHGGVSPYNFSDTVRYLYNECKRDVDLDLLFIVDGSSSVTQKGFHQTKEFLKGVISTYSIGPNDVQMSFIQYSTTPSVIFYLNTYHNKHDITLAIDKITYRYGSTDTSSALKMALDVFQEKSGSRHNASKILVLLTDGNDSDLPSTLAIATKLKEIGITIYTIGIGSHIDVAQLSQMSSPPSCTHVTQLPTYDQLQALTYDIQHTSCKTPIITRPGLYSYSCDTSVLLQIPKLIGGAIIQVRVSNGGVRVYGAKGSVTPGLVYSTANGISEDRKPVIIGIGSNEKYSLSIQSVISGTATCKGAYQIKVIQGNKGINGLKVVNPCTVKAISSGQTSFPYPNDKTKYLVCNKYGNYTVVKCPAGSLYELVKNICIPFHVYPCTKSSIETGKILFPHPYNKQLFLMCDHRAKLYVGECPYDQYFESNSQKCKVPTDIYNIKDPCTLEALATQHKSVPHPLSKTMYVLCFSGKSFEIHACPTGQLYRIPFGICETPVRGQVVQNPCTMQALSVGKTVFPHPYRDNRFIKCVQGMHFIIICPQNETFELMTAGCVPKSQLTKTKYSLQPWSSNQTGHPLPTNVPNPCTYMALLKGEFYFSYIFDKHKYIQCNVWGQALLKTCFEGRIWNHIYLTCYQAHVIDQTNKNRIDFTIKNPCKPITDSIIDVHKLYYPHPRNKHKFIQCDLAGQAFVLKCKNNMYWNQLNLTCENQVIT